MSQASKSLNKIAASEEYKALVTAIEAKDYATVAKTYLQMGEMVTQEKKQILEKIQGLARQNKDDDCQKFEAAFALRASSSLPQWHWLTAQLKEQGVMEGEVFGVGTRGDPLVRTAQGRVVVITGAALEKGARTRFKVITQGQRLDFGRVIELNAEYFAFLLNREARDNMKKCFDAVEERLRTGRIETDEAGLAQLGELLKGLEDIRELTGKLDVAERDSAMGKVVAYRRRLLSDTVAKLALDFMTREEEKEIARCCNGDAEQAAQALAAPGLFRYQAHCAFKARILVGGQLKGYSETLKDLQSKLVSMSAAVELMEFESAMEKGRPLADTYIQRIDGLFDRLQRKARQIALTLAEGKACSVEEIQSAVREAFSGPALCAELRRGFRDAEEFYALRGALIEMKSKLEDKANPPGETAVKPYLASKVAGAFEAGRVSGQVAR